MSLIPSGNARREACYADMRKLNATESKKLREAWFDGPCSGAKITIAEAERLFDLAGAQLYEVVAAALKETERVGVQIAYRNEQKKTARKRRQKKGR